MFVRIMFIYDKKIFNFSNISCLWVFYFDPQKHVCSARRAFFMGE